VGLRSLLVSMEWTVAGRAHDCRYNKKHRLEKGDRRLTIKSDGDEHNYCLACAKAFFEHDIKRLKGLYEQAYVSPASAG
jgi:hypothetical protein